MLLYGLPTTLLLLIGSWWRLGKSLAPIASLTAAAERLDAQLLAQPGLIQVTLPSCDEATVRGDRHRLKQLLLNLTDTVFSRCWWWGLRARRHRKAWCPAEYVCRAGAKQPA